MALAPAALQIIDTGPGVSMSVQGVPPSLIENTAVPIIPPVIVTDPTKRVTITISIAIT